VLDAHRLTLLAEVAHAGSIAGAAQRLSFTPSAVSQQLAKLERDVGAPVLNRHPRGVSLTPVGEALLAHAETIAGELRTAERTVRTLLGEEPAQLTVGTFASAGMTLVPAALARFRRDHPAVALRLLDLEPPDGYGLVSSRDLDLLITHRYPGAPLPDPRGLTRTLLRSERFRLILPKGHAMAGTRRLTLRALAGEDWISGSSGVPNRLPGTAGRHRRGGVAGRLRNARLPGDPGAGGGRAGDRVRAGERARPGEPGPRRGA
jgi:DNA-binding transcriptional LysR family regulator